VKEVQLKWMRGGFLQIEKDEVSLGQSWLAKVRGEVSPWPIMAGQRRERVRGILMMEVCGIWNFGKDLEFWKIENLVACGGRKRYKGKGKRKRNYKGEDIFLESKSENIERTDTRV